MVRRQKRPNKIDLSNKKNVFTKILASCLNYLPVYSIQLIDRYH